MALIRCTLCPNNCVMPEGGRGKCRIRIHLDGELYALTYGRPCAVHVDPIEKKPAFHYLPGSRSFSIATAGCCLNCKYCQNWQISQANPEDTFSYDLPPHALLAAAQRAHCKSIAYTYTEPTVFFEYMVDSARLAHQHGIGNVYVTCGFIKEKPLQELAEVLDATNIDLKGFNEDFYQRVTGGRLAPVLNCIKYLYQQGLIVEVTNLIVPSLNDTADEIRKMCQWIAEEVGPDVPIHFSRFSPHYKLKHLPPTPIATLQEAYAIAKEVGLQYIYIGNVADPEGQKTVCPNCNNVVVARRGYSVLSLKIKEDNTCAFCGHRIYGRWHK